MTIMTELKTWFCHSACQIKCSWRSTCVCVCVCVYVKMHLLPPSFPPPIPIQPPSAQAARLSAPEANVLSTLSALEHGDCSGSLHERNAACWSVGQAHFHTQSPTRPAARPLPTCALRGVISLLFLFFFFFFFFWGVGGGCDVCFIKIKIKLSLSLSLCLSLSLSLARSLRNSSLYEFISYATALCAGYNMLKTTCTIELCMHCMHLCVWRWEFFFSALLPARPTLAPISLKTRLSMTSKIDDNLEQTTSIQNKMCVTKNINHHC